MFDRKIASSAATLQALSQVRLSRRSLLKSAVALSAAGTLAGIAGGPNFLGGPQSAAAAPATSVVIHWNSALLAAIRATKPGPTVVSRALGVVHTAVYDAWAVYDNKARPTRPAGRRPANERSAANKDRAISYAAYRALVDLFPSQQAAFDGVMAGLGYDPGDTSLDPKRASGVGNAAAAAVLAFRHNDGSNQLNGYADTTGYAPVNTWDTLVDANRWQPLRVPNGQGGYAIQKFLSPHWGGVTPFGLSSGSEFRNVIVPSLKLYPDSHFMDQLQEVLDYSANLTDRQKAIAEYWADGPTTEFPPGHWNLIAQFVSARDRHNLDKDVQLFFILNCAIMDAGIAAWDCKRHCDSIRPGSAIRHLFAGRQIRAWAGPGLGTRVIDGAAWQPYQQATVNTPPFGEFVSGHSTFSRASAEVLKAFTGSDRYGGSHTVAAGSLLVEPGVVPATAVTLRWPSFFDAANEAGLSRLYGGIHIGDGDMMGRKLGEEVGKRAYDRAMALING